MPQTLTTTEFGNRPNLLFLRAGHAVFTVSNDKGQHYTYRIKTPDVDENTPEDRRKPIWFVGLLTGPDNGADYTYLGVYTPDSPDLRLTKASKMTADSLPVKVFKWAVKLVAEDRETPPGYSIARANRCGRCGRELTHPDGVADDGYRQGFGPICYAKLTEE